jgi:hypothetical protein
MDGGETCWDIPGDRTRLYEGVQMFRLVSQEIINLFDQDRAVEKGLIRIKLSNLSSPIRDSGEVILP